MECYSLNCGYFKLDGGAMFGIVPKTIWQRINPPDENNMCTWAMRGLLVKTGDRLVMVDSGMGDKQSEKFYQHYYPHGDDSLAANLRKLGYTEEDVTDHVLSHLHFDHAGGSIRWNDDRSGFVKTFPNATYWVGKRQFDHALDSNPKERNSYPEENILPLRDTAQCRFVEKEGELFPGFSVYFVEGHTEGMMLPVIEDGDRTLAYMADLIPSHGHMKMPYVMAYDIRPLDTMNEKHRWLEWALARDAVLMFEHDPSIECARLERTKKGILSRETFSLAEWTD
jgi:glyoxylase-like metal-dependent hydrolase (beta-lactamase superfamily II)